MNETAQATRKTVKIYAFDCLLKFPTLKAPVLHAHVMEKFPDHILPVGTVSGWLTHWRKGYDLPRVPITIEEKQQAEESHTEEAVETKKAEEPTPEERPVIIDSTLQGTEVTSRTRELYPYRVETYLYWMDHPNAGGVEVAAHLANTELPLLGIPKASLISTWLGRFARGESIPITPENLEAKKMGEIPLSDVVPVITPDQILDAVIRGIQLIEQAQNDAAELVTLRKGVEEAEKRSREWRLENNDLHNQLAVYKNKEAGKHPR